jgi:hypothetical protein
MRPSFSSEHTSLISEKQGFSRLFHRNRHDALQNHAQPSSMVRIQSYLSIFVDFVSHPNVLSLETFPSILNLFSSLKPISADMTKIRQKLHYPYRSQELALSMARKPPEEKEQGQGGKLSNLLTEMKAFADIVRRGVVEVDLSLTYDEGKFVSRSSTTGEAKAIDPSLFTRDDERIIRFKYDVKVDDSNAKDGLSYSQLDETVRMDVYALPKCLDAWPVFLADGKHKRAMAKHVYVHRASAVNKNRCEETILYSKQDNKSETLFLVTSFG